jgi:hypothetical protein
MEAGKKRLNGDTQREATSAAANYAFRELDIGNVTTYWDAPGVGKRVIVAVNVAGVLFIGEFHARFRNSSASLSELKRLRSLS